MQVAPPDLDHDTLVEELVAGWGHVAERIQFVPQGFGSYHWVVATVAGERLFLTVDDLDAKPWLGRDRDTVFGSLRACFATAVALRERAMESVLAPCLDVEGRSLRRITDRYSLAVFPFVDGHSGRWGEPLSASLGEELVSLLARLHTSAPPATGEIARPVGQLAGRHDLESALDGLSVRWGSGPYAEPARAQFTTHEGRLRTWLADYDRLALAVAASSEPPVLTHGEPHPGNLLQTDSGLRLIDWDTVATAPRERDLWMLAGHPELLLRYTEQAGRGPEPGFLNFYRLSWALEDLAAFVAVMRAPHDDNADTAKAWSAINDYFSEERQVYPWS